MGDFGPVIAAVITTTGAILIAGLGARRLSRKGSDGNGGTAHQLTRNLRELVETEQAKGEIWKERYEAEAAAHGATKVKLTQAQYEADTCQRRLDNAYADTRLDTATHVTRDERIIRPGETIGSGETGTE